MKLLRSQHALIHRYWHDTSVQMSDFKNEGVVASSARPYQANALKGEGQPIATVFPKEGVTGWADTTMLHTDAKHPSCAYQWMNWSLEPKVQGDVAAGSGRCRRHRRAARPARCWVRRAAKPTASTSSTKSPSGKRRRRRAASSCRTAAGPGLHRHHGRPLISPSYFKPPLCWLPALTPVTYDLYAPGDAFGCRLDAARIILRIGLVRLRVVAQSAEVI